MGKAKVVVVAALERAGKCLLSPQNTGTLDLAAEVVDRQSVQMGTSGYVGCRVSGQYEAEGRTWRDDVVASGSTAAPFRFCSEAFF